MTKTYQKLPISEAIGYLSRYPDLVDLVAEMAGETSQVCPDSELTLQYSIDIESAEEVIFFKRV